MRSWAARVIDTPTRLADETLTDRDNTSVGHHPLLGDGVCIGVQSTALDLGNDRLPASVRLAQRHSLKDDRSECPESGAESCHDDPMGMISVGCLGSTIDPAAAAEQMIEGTAK